jgi:hypothetical protein
MDSDQLGGIGDREDWFDVHAVSFSVFNDLTCKG